MKPLLFFLLGLLAACGPADHPSAALNPKKDTVCRMPETRADQDAKQAIHEAELRKK